MPKSDGFTKSIQLRVDEDFLNQIDEWLALRGHDWSRSEAIRTLVVMGTKIEPSRHGHINETLQHVFKFIDTVKDLADNPNFDELAFEIANMMNKLEEIDNRLEEVVQDRVHLRSQLTKMRSTLVSILVEVTSSQKKRKRKGAT